MKKKNESKENKKIILKKILKILEIILAIIAVIFASIILTQRVSNNEKALLGYRIYRVETGSMVPEYLVGDVILVKEKDFDKIKEGDDVSYRASSGQLKGNIITHRVVKAPTEDKDGEKYIKTKGIANSIEDPEVYSNQVSGIVIAKLRILSAFTRGINNIYVFYFLVIVPVTIYIFFNLLKANRKEFEK